MNTEPETLDHVPCPPRMTTVGASVEGEGGTIHLHQTSQTVFSQQNTAGAGGRGRGGGETTDLNPEPYRGISLIRKRPTPQDPARTPVIGLRQGPRGVFFLVRELPL